MGAFIVRKKNLILCLVLVCVTLLMAGCHEEEKYNTAKNDFLKVEQQWSKIDPAEKNVKKHDELGKQLDTKISEMQEIAKSETKLNNDLISLKKEYKNKNDMWNRAKAEDMAIKKMNAEVNAKGPAIDDPFAKYGKDSLMK